jgi:SAM-dependent methyltransferase
LRLNIQDKDRSPACPDVRLRVHAGIHSVWRQGRELWRTVGEIDVQRGCGSAAQQERAGPGPTFRAPGSEYPYLWPLNQVMLRRLHFSLWYFFQPPWDSGISPPELLEFLSGHPPGRAIDLGCGTGTNLITLVKHGWQATGVDFVLPAVRMARRKLAQARIDASVSVGDVTKLDGIFGPFDLALDLGCFHGIPNRTDYLRQLNRVLAIGGHWLMYGRLKSDPGASGPGLTPVDLDMIEAAGFRSLSRRDGLDRRGSPSAWFLYQRS